MLVVAVAAAAVVAAVVVVVVAHAAAVVQTGGCVFGSRGVRSCVLFESRLVDAITSGSPLWGKYQWVAYTSPTSLI
jgi:hypothetical protein